MKQNLFALLSAALLLTPSLQAQEISMFNGRDLSGWKGIPEFWSVQDGAITGQFTAAKAPRGNTFLVWQGGDISDFEFTCKYKLQPDNPGGKANSGVQFRAMPPASDFGLAGYQGEMDPGTLRPRGTNTHLNGCLMDDTKSEILAKSNEQAAASFRAGQWNDYRIVAVGNHIQIWVNNLPAVDTVETQNRFTSGWIGLQLHKFSGPNTVQFKDLKLRVLKGSAPSPIAGTPTGAPPAPPADPNQAIVETLSQQAPNASAWVLAPLDQGVPPDIRQNLTFLLEDLLDEAKSKPAGIPGAYKVGEQLCRTMIAALDERRQTLAAAGFRAVEAGARIGVSSQALEARRNYKMSWPQYAREESQRAELKSQAIGNAEVMKERPKLEWSQRTGVIQRQLDTLYSQFRDALRQSPPAK